MKSLFSIGLFVFILVLAVIYLSPDVQTAIIFISAIAVFFSLNNGMFEYMKNKTVLNLQCDKTKDNVCKTLGDPMYDEASLDEVRKRNKYTQSLLGYVDQSAAFDKESKLDNFLADENMAAGESGASEEKFDNNQKNTDGNVQNISRNIQNTSGNDDLLLPSENSGTYNYNLEYAPDKIGSVRDDYEKMERNKQGYTRCYKPLVYETNDCDLYSDMPADEKMSLYWREIGLRGKKVRDGANTKTANYYRTHYNTELDESEKKVWWEVEGFF